MWSMSRFSSKCKSYSKSLKSLKDKLALSKSELYRNYDETIVSKKIGGFKRLSMKHDLYKDLIQKHINSIGTIQSDIKEKYLDGKEHYSNTLKEQLRKRNVNFIKRWSKQTAILTAVAVSAKDELLHEKPLANVEIADPIVAQSFETSSHTVSEQMIIEPIPEPPPIPDIQILDQINALGEPSFASLGLGGWTPVGMVQQCFEYIHVTLGIPWWEAIVIGTIVIRFCMFPLVIISQRNAAKMNNHLPQLQAIQLKMTEARQSGNQLEVARYSQELMLFMKEKNVNPFKNMIVPLAQMPVFVSFFMGLRQMANTPVDSLRDGGLFWFTDLTVPDQFLALPIITSFTLWATIELGTDSARLSSQNLQTMKYVLRAMPLLILPFTVNFPGAILCYWVSSNFISLAQVGFLKIPAVRDYFKIDPLITHNPQNLPIKNKGFVGGIKDSWTNIKITKEIEERRRLDEIQFQRAGKGPMVKTYKHDPTKHTSEKPAISAKKR